MKAIKRGQPLRTASGNVTLEERTHFLWNPSRQGALDGGLVKVPTFAVTAADG